MAEFYDEDGVLVVSKPVVYPKKKKVTTKKKLSKIVGTEGLLKDVIKRQTKLEKMMEEMFPTPKTATDDAEFE